MKRLHKEILKAIDPLYIPQIRKRLKIIPISTKKLLFKATLKKEDIDKSVPFLIILSSIKLEILKRIRERVKLDEVRSNPLEVNIFIDKEGYNTIFFIEVLVGGQ